MSIPLAAFASGLVMGGDGFPSPDFNENFYPEAFLFAGTPFEINRIVMVRLVATFVLVLLLFLYSRRAKLVPGRAQAAMEFLLDFSRKNIGEEILGDKARDYQGLLATIFLGILFMNITGIVPGLQIAGTSIVGMPLVFAVVAYVAFIVAGVREHGFGGFFRDQLFPSGVPPFMYVLITPIEALSTFVLRPVTLTVRLLANMMSGHLLLVVCFVGTQYLVVELGGAMAALGSLTLLGGIVFTAFEAFIAALQAYIFTLLTAVYIQLSIAEH